MCTALAFTALQILKIRRRIPEAAMRWAVEFMASQRSQSKRVDPERTLACFSTNAVWPSALSSTNRKESQRIPTGVLGNRLKQAQPLKSEHAHRE